MEKGKKKDEKEWNNQIKFNFRAAQPWSNTLKDSGIPQTDSQTGQGAWGGSGRKEDERVHFSSCPGTAENICGIFLYLVEHMRHIQRLSVVEFWMCQRMWECDISRGLCQHAYKGDTTQEWWQTVTGSLRYSQISRTLVTHGYVTLICTTLGYKRTYQDHLQLTADDGQHTKVAFKYFSMLQLVSPTI